jgi:hypothetical protein
MELVNLRRDLQLNSYPQGFSDSTINSKGSSHLNKKEKPLGSVYIPYVKDVSEKFKCIGNWYNIKTIFKTKHTLRSSLKKTRPEKDLQQTAQCNYSILCESDRSCICKTGKSLAAWLCEHRHNLKEGLPEKSKLAQHAYEEGHRRGWDEARIWEIKSNIRCRKYKESAHMSCLTNSVQPAQFRNFPIWIPLSSKKITNSQSRSVWCDRFFMGLYKVLISSVQFLLHSCC